MLYNHNEDAGVLARCKNGKGSLRFNVDERGEILNLKQRKRMLE